MTLKRCFILLFVCLIAAGLAVGLVGCVDVPTKAPELQEFENNPDTTSVESSNSFENTWSQ